MLHRILIPRLFFFLMYAVCRYRLPCNHFVWCSLIQATRKKRTAPPTGKYRNRRIRLCMFVRLMAVRRIALITVTAVNVNFYNWKTVFLFGYLFIFIFFISLFFKWPNMTDICDSRRCGFSSPSVIWWISADVRPQNRHVKIFVVHSFNRSCLTRHFWLIFYISPCIQIKSRARCLSSLHFRDVNKRRSECARRDVGQLLSDQSPITPTAVPILKAFGWRVINRK